MSLDELLAIIGIEGESRKKDCIPPCFGTAKVLELVSDVQCIKCEDWKYKCSLQYSLGNNLGIDFKSDNLHVEGE